MSVGPSMKPNGPAIWGGCVTRHSIRAGSWYSALAGPESYPGARRVWHVFLQSRYKVGLTLRVSRYKVDRSHEFIPGYKVGCEQWRSVAVQFVSKPEICQGILDFNCLQMSVSGYKKYYEFVLSAGTKAKTVTNNLPILSVLGKVLCVLSYSRVRGMKSSLSE
jgi:hypothetical protein